MTAPTFLAILTSHPPPSVGQVTIGPSRDPVPHDGKRLPGSPLPRRATVVRPKSRATAAPPAPAIAGTPDWLGVRPRIDGDLAQARRRLATLGGGDDEVRALLEPVRAALDDLGAAFPALVAQADAFAEAVAGAADREELKALGRELAGEERLLRLSVKEQLLGNRVRQEAAPVRGRKQAEPQDHSDGTPDVLRAVYRELLLGINAERLAAGLDPIEPVQIAPASPASTVRRCTPGPAVECHVRAGEASARLLADHGSTLRRFHRRLRHPPWRGALNPSRSR